MKTRTIIGRAPQKQHSFYPFDLYGEMADRHIIEQLFASPDIDDEIKSFVSESVLIDANPVAQYYYMETDQEYWDVLKDFPNCAPPFEQFTIFYDMPEKIVSSVHGTTDTSNYPYSGYIICCKGIDLSISGTFETDEEKKAALDYYEHVTKLPDIAKNAIKMLSSCMSQEMFNAVWQQLPEDVRFTLSTYKDNLIMRDMAQNGNWEALRVHLLQAKQSAPDMRWIFSMAVYLRIPNYINETFELSGPIFIESYCVDQSGCISSENKKAAGLLMVPQATMDYIERLAKINSCSIQFVKDGIKSVIQNAMQVALLSVSFMHCKNVSLEKETRQIQKRYAKKSRETQKEEIAFHTLNIHPMRQVLKTEGMEEKTGTKRALHICRGHFRHYENGRGLFGKYKGTYWMPQHLRGSKEQGQVIKDYTIQTK